MEFDRGIAAPKYTKHTKSRRNRANSSVGTAVQSYQYWWPCISVPITVTGIKYTYLESYISPLSSGA